MIVLLHNFSHCFSAYAMHRITSHFDSNPDARIAFENARNMTRHYSKSFYFSASVLPRQCRWATYAVYGFCRYADNLVDNPRARTHDEIRHEVEILANELRIAYRTGESEHPIIRSFVIAARAYAIPIEYPLDLLRGVVMDLEYSRYATYDDLYVFCYRVASVVGLMMTCVLGYSHPSALVYAEKMGIAMQLTNILRDIEEDAERGRIYLPQEELERFGVTEQDILERRMTPQIRALMQFQSLRAEQLYHEAEPGILMLPADTRFAIYSASKIYRGILPKIEANDYNPFCGRVYVPTSRKMRILLSELARTRIHIVQSRLNLLS
jgi:phytoene synthase